MPTQKNITLYEGNDETIHIRNATADEGTADEQVIDLTGRTITAYIKTGVSQDKAVAVQLTTTGGEITIVDGPAGDCDVEIPASAAIPIHKKWHVDIDLDGKNKTIANGDVTVIDL